METVNTIPAAVDAREVEAIREETSSKVAFAESYQVTDAATCAFAETFAREMRALEKKIDEKLGPAKKATYAGYKAVLDLIKELQESAIKARKIMEPKTVSYRKEEARKLAEENERRRVEAQRKADEERLSRAVKAEESGSAEMAEAILDRETVAPIPERVEPEKTDGVTYRDNWKARVVDEKAVPREWCSPDEMRLNAYAKAMKSAGQIPGVEIYNDRVPVYKTK